MLASCEMRAFFSKVTSVRGDDGCMGVMPAFANGVKGGGYKKHPLPQSSIDLPLVSRSMAARTPWARNMTNVRKRGFSKFRTVPLLPSGVIWQSICFRGTHEERGVRRGEDGLARQIGRVRLREVPHREVYGSDANWVKCGNVMLALEHLTT